jgi:hypothetical protein
MAQSARAIVPAEIWFRPPANDNDSRPGDTDGDRWRWLIERIKTIDTPMAIVATRSRLRGMRCEDFCSQFLRGAKIAGWDCLED